MLNVMLFILFFVGVVLAWVFVYRQLKKMNINKWLRHAFGALVGILSGVFVLAYAVALTTPETSSSNSASAVADAGKTQEVEPSAPAQSDLSSIYTILSDETQSPHKRTVEVELSERLEKEELAEIARRIKQQGVEGVERTFIGYRLAEQRGGGPYWVTTSYTPDLEVRIIGTTSNQEREIASSAAGPRQYRSIKAMFVDYGDYLPERNQFELYGVDPLHIRVSPLLNERTSDDIIREDNWRALTYALFNTFIHTDAPQVIVDSVPLLYKNPREVSNAYPVMDLGFRLSMSRQEALSAVQGLLKIETLAELKKPTETIYVWTDAFDKYRYEEIEQLVDRLRPYCEGACR